jgi:hypothetical protein
MTTSHRVSRGLAAASLSLLTSCGEPTSPSRAAGVYVLTQVAGDALPTALLTNESVRIMVIADTLRLSPDGTGVRTSAYRTDFLSILDKAPESSEHSQAFSFRVTGDRVEIGFHCPPNANCAPPPHIIATRSGEGLDIEFAGGSRVPQGYRIVR